MDAKTAAMLSLEGKTAVVTGGGGDICSVLSRALAGAGARVAVLDLSLPKAQAVADSITGEGGQARAWACDVLDRASLEAVRASITADWGRPDILVNGAGGNMPGGSTAEEFSERAKGGPRGGDFFSLDLAGLKATFDLNLLGTLLPTMVFAEAMAEAGSGSVLNISSMGALTPLTKVGAYSAAKAAVSNLTAWLAVHFAHTGVRVNAIAPGFLMTEQLKFLHVDQKTGEPTARSRKVVAHTPMGRYGRPEELVGAVLFLLSSASTFVTGIVVPVDGGFSSYSI